jgi:hypothetical protein
LLSAFESSLQAAPFVSRPEVLAFRVPAQNGREPWHTRRLCALPALLEVNQTQHPEQAGVQIALLQTLLDRGARLDQPSAAGNAHSVVYGCLANGQPKAAEFLAQVGAPLDLAGAAGLGKMDLVRSYFDQNGAPRPPVDRRQMESAFEQTCWYGRKEAVEFLLDRGLDPGLRSGRDMTGLHRAAYTPHIDVLKLLLERGAPVDAKEDEFHATALDVALWVWSRSADEVTRVRCYEAIALLAQNGASLDPNQWSGPASDGPRKLEKIRADSRMEAALRDEMPR